MRRGYGLVKNVTGSNIINVVGVIVVMTVVWCEKYYI